MDVLSSVLEAARFSGAILTRAEFSAPWAVSAPPARDLAPLLLADPNRSEIVLFHVVGRGRCCVGLGAGRTLELGAGDVVVIRGSPHTLSDAPGRAAVPFARLVTPGAGAAPPLIRLGGGGSETSMTCGYFQFDGAGFNPLLAALPPALHVPAQDEAAGRWLRGTLEYFIRVADATTSGSAVLLNRLAELLFVEVVRHHAAGLPLGARSWLAALRDPVVGRALELLHGAAARPWTVESLSREVAISRSALAARFAEMVGETPMHYLARWRIHLGSQLLRERRDAVAGVAARVGYASEAAFSRAFKRLRGEAPGAWLRRTPEAPPPPSAGGGSSSVTRPTPGRPARRA